MASMNQLFDEESSSDESAEGGGDGPPPAEAEAEADGDGGGEGGGATAAPPAPPGGSGDDSDEDEDGDGGAKSGEVPGGGGGGDGGGVGVETGAEEQGGQEEAEADAEDGEKKRSDPTGLADSDDDDEDAEFDDADAGVAGRSATAAEQKRIDQAEEARRAAEAAEDPFAEEKAREAERARAAGEDGGADGEGGSGDEDGGKAPPPPKTMEVLDIQRPHQLKKSSGITMHMTKLPNIVGINPEAYDPDTHDPAMEEEEYRGYVHNMVRWRYARDADGNMLRDDNKKLKRESNSRFVKWSDGSYTLHVGDEMFEVDNIVSRSATPGFAGVNGYLYLSQKAKYLNEEDADGPPVTGPTVLECMGQIKSKLVPRPSSLGSEAHKNLTLAVRQRNMKKARIAEYVTQVDPEKEKMERIKNKNDLNQQAARGGRRPARRGGRRPGMNRRYLEEDDGFYETTDLHDLRRRNRMDEADYGSEGSGEDEWSKRKKQGFQRGSRRPLGGYGDSASEEEEEEEEEEEAAFGEDSSEDEDAKITAKARKKRSHHQALIDDDDDDD